MRARAWLPLAIAAACTVALFRFPDLDIPLLGIGNHRYFLFHSALLPLTVWLWVRKRGWVGLAIVCGFALAVGTHLVTDVFQTKAVVFPWAKTLIRGTSLDDRLWEGGNAAVCGLIAWRSGVGWRRGGVRFGVNGVPGANRAPGAHPASHGAAGRDCGVLPGAVE